MEGRPLSAMTDHEVEACLTSFMHDILTHVEAMKQHTLPSDNPYRGLDTFRERDRDVFFGRDAIAQQLCENLRQSPVLCLVGSSGSGKSSLVYAGVVPRLQDKDWLVVPLRPRRDPLYGLAQGLGDLLRSEARRGDSLLLDEEELVDKLGQETEFLVHLLRRVADEAPQARNVLLFVDQFEELFTNCDQETRARFLSVLLHSKRLEDPWAIRHLHCLLTLRFDFLEQAVHERETGLGDALQLTKPQLLGDLSDDQLRDVIERPAQRKGASFERGLVEQILNDVGVGNERGKLPLLEFCLQRLWIQQTKLGGRVLTGTAYKHIGGFRGAVTQYADEVFDDFSPEEQAATPGIFVHLVNVATDDQGGDTRRPVPKDELVGGAPSGPGQLAASLVDKLINKRLLVKGEGRHRDSVTVELAHEILIQAWQRLKDWVEKNRDFLKQLRLVEVAMRNGQPLAGSLLDECEAWLNDPTRRQVLSTLVVRFIERSLATQAEMQINALLDCKVATLPGWIDQLKYRPTLAPILKRRLEVEHDHEARRRLSLALLKMEEGPLNYLSEQLLVVEPAEFAVICEALKPYRARLWDGMWQRVLAATTDQGCRLRAACSLAQYDPDDPRWVDLARHVAKWLVEENPLHIAGWLESLLPVRDRLFRPLAELCKNRQQADSERALAATSLSGFGPPEVLADVLLEANAKQFGIMWASIQAHREIITPILHAELSRPAPPENQPEARDVLARRQAQAAVALLHLGESEPAWPLLRHGPDPGRRTYLLHAFGPLGIPVDVLHLALESHTCSAVRRALILGLGEFTAEQLRDEQRQPIVHTLLQWYRDDADPGIHAAIDWLLRPGRQGDFARKLDWGQREALEEIDRELAGQQPGDRNWYVSRAGHTFVIISDSGPFQMGSPPEMAHRRPDETPHLRRIRRRFEIASKQVTLAQFAAFRREEAQAAFARPTPYSPTDDCPQSQVTWFEAAAYCNWLSQRHGIPQDEWCYVPTNQGYAAGMKVAENHLSRSGYRLPTEAEWEYSCRSGSSTSWYYGSVVELLGRYAWFNKNSDRTWPVGSLKPNDFGFFDLMGNVEEWCQDRYRTTYPTPGAEGWVEDIEDPDDVTKGVLSDNRVLRGGGFLALAALVRSADRDKGPPDVPQNWVGFRPARTRSVT